MIYVNIPGGEAVVVVTVGQETGPLCGISIDVFGLNFGLIVKTLRRNALTALPQNVSQFLTLIYIY